MNQYYSAELSQKVLRGLKESYIKGNFTGGWQTYGYDVVDKKIVVDENEAEIVEEIFKRFAKGETGKSITDNLKERGIRTKRGKPVDDKYIYKIIANMKYTGKVKHGDEIYTNIYPALIDEQTWQIVQAIREVNKHKPCKKKEKYNYILSGKLICGDCKEFMVGITAVNRFNVTYKYYTCLSKRRKKHKCPKLSIHKELLEDIVFQKNWDMIYANNDIDQIVSKIYEFHQNNNEGTYVIQSLERKRAEALKSSSNLISAIEQGIITEQTKERLKQLETEILQLDFDIEQAKQRTHTNLTPEMIKEYFSKVVNGDIKNAEIRKAIARLFIREIILYKDKIVITYNFTDKRLTKRSIPDKLEDIEPILNLAENQVFKKDIGLYKSTHGEPRNLYEPR